MSFTSDLGPDVDEAISKVLDTIAELTEKLEPVERIIALVVLQLFIEGEKAVMDPGTREAFEKILEQSSATVFPIFGAEGEE